MKGNSDSPRVGKQRVNDGCSLVECLGESSVLKASLVVRISVLQVSSKCGSKAG